MSLIGRRRKSLAKQGFLPWEYRGVPGVKGLSTMTFSHSPWFRRVRRERARELRDMRQVAYDENWSRARLIREWRTQVKQIYEINGWQLADGTLDVWQMFREYRARAIQRGEWDETPRKRGSRRRKVETATGLVRIDKGRIREQRDRYRERQRGY